MHSKLMMFFWLAWLGAAVTAYAGSTWYPGGGGGGGTVTAVTGTPPIASSGGTTPAISISQSGFTTNGYLASGDWATFNGKGAVTTVTGTAPVVSSGGSSPAISMPVATLTANGYLASSDWAVFNGRAASGANADITSLSHIAKLYPASNGVAAVQILKADGTTGMFDVDTTNSRIGIGSAAPVYQLTVDGGNLDAASGNGVINIVSNPTNFGPELRMNNLASGHAWILLSGGNGDAVGNQNFGIQDGGTERLVIAGATGNVGIGSTNPAAKLDVVGTTKLGAAGVAFTAAGGCTISSTTITTTVSDLTCTGVPASAAVAVACTGQAAFSTATANGLYCRATGTVSQVECNTIVANTTAMAYSCTWVQP